MAGIYLHIPFCRKACHYCNFHFSTNLKRLDDLVLSIQKEILARKGYFAGERIETLYFGGGTPSLLSASHMQIILEALRQSFDLSDVSEFTVEINPEDVTSEKLELWKESKVNRLSIGVQSFFEDDLQFMNRNHNADQSINAVRLAQDQGFDNITIDLIFGAQSCSDDMWKENLNQLINLNINHASIYGLTIEENTALHHFINSGKANKLDEEKSTRQFKMTMDRLSQEDYEQYEISNYAKPGFRSKHNSSYWTGKKYLGLGPSAHSFDGVSRFWSVSNNQKYINQANSKQIEYQKEELSRIDSYNEWVMTGLRMIEGLDISIVKVKYPEFLAAFNEEKEKHIYSGNIIQIDNRIRLTTEGKFISDGVIADFFQL